MNIADELRKLQDLHQSGALTDQEFAAAKAAVLAGEARGAEPEPGVMQQHLDEIRLQNEVARLDREWELEREQYVITGRYGYRYLPNKTMSVIMGVVIVVFGIFWTVMAFGMVGEVSGPFILFPLFGVVFIAAGVGMSIYGYNKATAYEKAYQEYQRRRAELLGGPAEPRQE
jgi:hypothetical protein